MRVLAHDEWLAGGMACDKSLVPVAHSLRVCRLVSKTSALLEPLHRRIHRRVDVCILVSALPMDWARRIDLLHRRNRMAETVAVPRLVAHRPERDGRVVAVEDSLTLVALDDRVFPLLEAAKPIVAVPWFMSLDVRLGYYVDSIPVAEVVPEAMVGIMAGANGVDVVLLEERDVLQHVVKRHGAAVLWVRLMTVDALHLDRHAVHEERVADDFLLLEPDLLRTDVAALLHDERVKIWIFRAPETRFELELEVGVGERFQISNFLLVCIVKRGRPTILQLQLETPTLNPVQTTSDDIARGWRVECAATNENISYEMPSNGSLVGNWHVHGAASSFGNNVVDFGVVRTSGTLVPTNWAFPIGTNNEAFSSFWYFIDGRIRPTPKDAAHEICAVGVPMSAVPGRSRLWTAEEPDGARVITWENFFLGGDTNAPVNAQIVLCPNGDFVTRSNDVETVCCRVNPDDWDDDGIPNDEDANITVCDGDFFGPANILPEGANTNAYCTVSLVATGPDALVTFAGDKPCNYPDPRFVAKSGVTNEVVILIGKTYAISSDWPFAVVGVSDPDTEVWQMRGAAHQTYVRRPVTIAASDGNPFTMSVVPLNLGGVFLWPSAQCHCSISGSGGTFTWNCPMDCTCCGCAVEGQYSYEGYWLPATSCLCGCHYDGTGPMWEPSSAPLAASVSATFSKSAVIFEDAYENQPGQWVGKNSTRTRLNIVANGGTNGGTLSVTSANIGKLSRISGPDLPLAFVAVPAEMQVSYAIVYEGATASAVASDIIVTAVWTTDHPMVSEYVPPWTNGSKVWCIPVGWGQPGVLKGRIMPDPTTQRFEITEAGVVTIEKYQHVIMRDTANGVWLDGEREN